MYFIIRHLNIRIKETLVEKNVKGEMLQEYISERNPRAEYWEENICWENVYEYGNAPGRCDIPSS